MDLNKIIGDLIEQNGGMCALDKLHLPYAHESAGPAAKFGLGCELYLPNIDRKVLRDQAVQFLIDYHRMFPKRLDRFLPMDVRRAVKISEDLEAQIESDCAKFPVKDGYSVSLFGDVDIGLPKDDVRPYQAHTLVGRETRKRLSFVSAFMPICNDASEVNFEMVLSSVLRWCTLFKPVHGGAGFSLVFASAMEQNSIYALQLMKRFPGIDFIDGVAFSRETENEQNKFKCVNWLTVLCDDLVAQLGGVDAMKEALEPPCRVHTYPGGVVIQAGLTPQIGDAQRGEIPAAYRAVARFTKSVRFENYDEYLFRAPDGLDDRAETLEWIRRFD